jgi:nucleoid-associated protein YgaU
MRRRLWAARVAAALLATAGMGCGKPVLRVADASLGDYYTEKEFRKLSAEQRQEYCNELALQDSMYLDEIRESSASLAEANGRRDPLRREADSLLAEAGQREQNIRTLLAAREGEPAPGGGGEKPHGWSVRRGDSLWRISGRGDVYGDGRKWTRIYESNRGLIRDPDLIFPGQELSIPR